MSSDAVAGHFQELEIGAIVVVEQHPQSDSRLAVEEPQVRASSGVRDEIDALGIAGISCAARRVQAEAHVSAIVKCNAESLPAGGISNCHSSRWRYAVEVVANRSAENDTITSRRIFDYELPSPDYVRRGRLLQESRCHGQCAGDAQHDQETINPA
jgi:hypothetical protein